MTRFSVGSLVLAELVGLEEENLGMYFAKVVKEVTHMDGSVSYLLDIVDSRAWDDCRVLIAEEKIKALGLDS